MQTMRCILLKVEKPRFKRSKRNESEEQEPRGFSEGTSENRAPECCVIR
jgi:hypothetical protein